MSDARPDIELSHVGIRYGRRVAVDDINLRVARGSVYALLGRNGAGKSSLVRALLGQLQPQHGSIALFGEDVWRRRAQLMERVGVVAEETDAPPEMRVRDLGRFCAKLYARWDAAAYDARIARFEIEPLARYGELSKGQRKQVSLALALASSPQLLVLDDPTLGLDVVARKALFDEVIVDLADRGITVFIATHDLAATESIADRVGILRGGRLVLDEEVETLKARFRRIRVADPPAALAHANLRTTAVRQWGGGTEAVVSNYDDLALAKLGNVAEAAAMSLEDIFIAVAGEAEGGQS
ncbi:MAG: ABC transporter ATP-binding protein [Acidobacteria bacterium]|nr:ABC transporter ATP-binding protein [Acidobacteriota bacterium]MBV9477083.1 ABC transporter ATP-binding protein [Acidobacteriota bacterium]